MITLRVPGAEVVLPNPEFNDAEAVDHDMTLYRAMNGKRYSYVRSSARSRLTYVVPMSRHKSIELQEFLISNINREMLLTNHKEEIWRGTIQNNPFEFSTFSRSINSPGGERVSCRIEFIGVKL